MRRNYSVPVIVFALIFSGCYDKFYSGLVVREFNLEPCLPKGSPPPESISDEVSGLKIKKREEMPSCKSYTPYQATGGSILGMGPTNWDTFYLRVEDGSRCKLVVGTLFTYRSKTSPCKEQSSSDCKAVIDETTKKAVDFTSALFRSINVSAKLSAGNVHVFPDMDAIKEFCNK